MSGRGRGRGRGRGGYRGNNHNSYHSGSSHSRGGHGDGGGRGRHNKPYNPDDQRIGYKLLESKSTASPTDALMFCNNKAFLNFLEDDSLHTEQKSDWVDLILATLNQALQADDTMSDYRETLKLALVPQNPCYFLNTTCTFRLMDGFNSSQHRGINIEKLIKSFENYLNIFHHLCSMDPLMSKALLADIQRLKQYLRGVVMDFPQLHSVSELYNQATSKVEKAEQQRLEEERAMRIGHRTRRYMTEKKPEGNFREMSLHPTEQDLKAIVNLRVNKVKGAFDGVEDYLDVQFRLLREDFVSTLRTGIRDYRDNPHLTGDHRFRSGDVKAYENFTITSPNFGRNGITYVVSINKEDKMFRRINWASSKRLLFGSLLCLSTDCFTKNILFATIAERDVKVMEKDGVFEIQFLADSQQKYDMMENQAGPFVAVESMAYFEAYSHVLNGIQKINENNFALSKYIVEARTTVSRPEYLKRQDVKYRFITTGDMLTEPTSLHDVSQYMFQDSFSMYNSRNASTWPTANNLGFNESQYQAFKTALTQEFVVIQGPPGTGKTFLGLKIVETLLFNLFHVPGADLSDISPQNLGKKHSLRSVSSNMAGREANCPERVLGQMLVVCFTNHALDQFLEGMLQFCPPEDIVRVGNRCQNEVLNERCNIRVQRGRQSRDLHQAFLELRAKRENFMADHNLEPMMRLLEMSRTKIMHHDTRGLLAEHPTIYSQFEDMARKLQKQEYNPKDMMSIWLQIDAEAYASQSQSQMEPEGPDESLDQLGVDSVDVEGEAERELQSRLFDDDDENSAFVKRLRKKLNKSKASTDVGVEGVEVDSEGFQKVKLSKKARLKRERLIRSQIMDNNIMTQEELNSVKSHIQHYRYNVTTDMELPHRWRLYRYLVKDLQKQITKNMKDLQMMYTDIVKLGDNLRKQEDINALRKAKVIGMTTTGAARMQSVLQQVGPEIVVVEEAAEVLEAHIITALSKHCKHLILIGDHKQLKPNPTVYDLAKQYHLDLSLFERMVNNGLPVKTLNIQHRMRPEVSKYMRHIYDRLDDHSSVIGRSHVEGITKDVYFFNHSCPESSDSMTMSHSNEFEADMVVGLTRYFLRQKSYEPSDVTIITMYTGQLLLLKKKMPKAEFEGVKITSVDNFQGEENKILIISLVRSNTNDNLGFVKIENRVCVCLSRAQYGMYVFGNFDMLSRGSEMWKKMVNEAKASNEFGSKLVLQCRRHKNPAEIEKPEDFQKKSPAGGCTRICRRQLNCGHTCKMSCHSKDLEHKDYQCTEPCPKTLSPCNHPCTRMCHQSCSPCQVRRQIRLPCQHIQDVPCFIIYDSVKQSELSCREPCPKKLNCGHACKNRCSAPCTSECEETVQQMCSRCFELKDVPCYQANQRMSLNISTQRYIYKCDTPCTHTLSCGHQCAGTCYKCETEGHMNCIQTCHKQLVCGHNCRSMCHDCTAKGKCLDCNQKCNLKCSHGTKCTRLCKEACSFHPNDTGKVCNWGCTDHDKCERKCGEPCSHVPCDMQCGNIYTCSKCKNEYRCMGVCGEQCTLNTSPCPKCKLPSLMVKVGSELAGLITEPLSVATKWVMLEDCRHLVPMTYMDRLIFKPESLPPFLCPYGSCKKPVLNTPRYVSKTRAFKFTGTQGSRFRPSIAPRSSVRAAAAHVPPAMPSFLRSQRVKVNDFYSGLQEVSDRMEDHRDEEAQNMSRVNQAISLLKLN